VPELSQLFAIAIFEMTKAKAKTKMKTHKATKKRFRLSASGKAMHRHAGTSHLATGLSKKRRRNLRGTTAVHTCMESTIQAALNGYSN
jgi:large subunit ribosomal protein L35